MDKSQSHVQRHTDRRDDGLVCRHVDGYTRVVHCVVGHSYAGTTSPDELVTATRSTWAHTSTGIPIDIFAGYVHRPLRRSNGIVVAKHSSGLHIYGLHSHGLNRCGLHTYGLHDLRVEAMALSRPWGVVMTDRQIMSRNAQTNATRDWCPDLRDEAQLR